MFICLIKLINILITISSDVKKKKTPLSHALHNRCLFTWFLKNPCLTIEQQNNIEQEILRQVKIANIPSFCLPVKKIEIGRRGNSKQHEMVGNSKEDTSGDGHVFEGSNLW